MQMMNDQMKL